MFFSPFSIAITSLGEERSNLGAFRTFVRFALVWFCLFPLPLGVWEGLRLMIVALPGLFSYLFWWMHISTISFPTGNNCAPLLADQFLYSYKADFIQDLMKAGNNKKKKKNLAQQLNSTYRYKDDVLSLNN